MEEGIFQRPAVAGELAQSFVEARLHCDAEPPIERNMQLERELSRTEARPTFVIVDPTTGKSLRRKRGLMTEERFLAFLRGVEPPK